MSSDTFRRHTRACVDAAIHRVFSTHRDCSFFERLLHAVRARSDLMQLPPQRDRMLQVTALEAMLPFEHALVREPESWAGARGHPLVVMQSLATHLFGHHPTPRFLAWAWLGWRLPARAWFVAHAQGQRFRSLDLPLAMTRQMEHVFLHTPDHYPVEHALRRAEVIALGGSPALADVILATQLGECFDDPERWRLALAWLARCSDTVELAQVRPLVDFLQANDIKLRGRTFASVMRLVRAWHESLAHQRVRLIMWRPTRWNGLIAPVSPTSRVPRASEWAIHELTDSRQLAGEGRAMHHCVAGYASKCLRRESAIWSLRRRWDGQRVARSVLTIEVQISTGAIIQIRGKANSVPEEEPMRIVRAWAMREGLLFDSRLGLADGVRLAA
jgi:hypothetical protein